VQMTQEQIVRELRSGLPIHRHSGDPEPRLSPFSVCAVHSLMSAAANLIETLSADRESEMRENADLLEEFKQIHSQIPRWISVEERLPENIAPVYEHDMNNAVLLYTPVDGYVHIGWYVRRDYRGRDVWHTLSAMRSHQTLTKKVTHWMPLPEPPKEECA